MRFSRESTTKHPQIQLHYVGVSDSIQIPPRGFIHTFFVSVIFIIADNRRETCHFTKKGDVLP
jgi:hypothetical protein